MIGSLGTGAGVAWVAVPALAAVGALAPDIDHPKSLIGNGVPAELLARGIGVLALGVAGAWLVSRALGEDVAARVVQTLQPLLTWAGIAAAVGVALLLISLVVPRLVKHRGPTHSLVFAAGAGALACAACAAAGLPWTYGLAFGWGYLSHLLGDAVTASGCPSLLWPLVRRR